jgi:hypothetical protein
MQCSTRHYFCGSVRWAPYASLMFSMLTVLTIGLSPPTCRVASARPGSAFVSIATFQSFWVHLTDRESRVLPPVVTWPD